MHLRAELRVLDAGSGRWPILSPEVRRRHRMHVTGLDLEAEQLSLAAADSYDATIVGDVSQTELPQAGYDLILSRTLLEHLPNVDATIRNLASALKPGGFMLHVLPNRRAPFTAINRMLGNRWGRRVLHALYPDSRSGAGFPAFYDRCTPAELTSCCRDAGLSAIDVIPYYATDYFSFCLPLYLFEFLRQSLLEASGTVAFSELFALIAQKPAASRDAVLPDSARAA